MEQCLIGVSEKVAAAQSDPIAHLLSRAATEVTGNGAVCPTSA